MPAAAAAMRKPRQMINPKAIEAMKKAGGKVGKKAWGAAKGIAYEGGSWGLRLTRGKNAVASTILDKMAKYKDVNDKHVARELRTFPREKREQLMMLREEMLALIREGRFGSWEELRAYVKGQNHPIEGMEPRNVPKEIYDKILTIEERESIYTLFHPKAFRFKRNYNPHQ